jgi:ABC-type sugar transport system ATPase subunit
MSTTETARDQQQAACAVSGVKKSYGGVRALVGVDLSVYPGHVHAIVGENGAGKSTLMKALVGAVQPDDGSIYVGGQNVSFANVKEANEHGVAIVFQELSLFPELDVLANLFLKREPLHFGLIARQRMRRQAEPVLAELGLSHLDLDAPVGNLTLGEQQLIEIAKALLAEARVLIFDEPNSALNATESDRLFAIIRGLRDRGVAVIYISHRLEEVFEIADLITVMRNGEIVDTVRRDQTAIPEIVRMMIGREPTEFYAERDRYTDTGEALRLENVAVDGKIEDINLTAAAGEIVGLAGLEGAGAQTVLHIIFGIESVTRGRIILPDGCPAPRSIPAAVESSIAYVPADRRHGGAMLKQTVMENLSHVTAGALGRFGFFLNRSRLKDRARARCTSLNIVMESLESPVDQLSGGNQQKVVLGKWLEASPNVVLLNDPTRGVDVGAKEEIYHIIRELADEGRVVLFTSSELPEFVHLCDRVVIFYKGRIAGEFEADALTEQKLLEAINTGQLAQSS